MRVIEKKEQRGSLGTALTDDRVICCLTRWVRLLWEETDEEY